VVRAVALGREETVAALGMDLTALDVQPVWIEIDNGRADGFWLYPHAVDEDYFPPYLVAWRAARANGGDADGLYARLRAAQMPYFIPAGATARGFVYAGEDQGAKAFSVELRGPDCERLSFHFLSPVPGLPTDHLEAPDDLLADPSAPSLDDEGLRRWLAETAPALTRAADGTDGDPVNVALIGAYETLVDAMISSGWDATAPTTAESVLALAGAYLDGSCYRYAPISDLHVFDRPQDLAFQRARPTVAERDHIRLWLAPVRHDGLPVWLGQISRDDGVKLSGRVWPPTTHVIDPEVDEARFLLQQTLIAEGRVARIAFVDGGRAAPSSAPARNAEGDRYVSDGRRAVLFLRGWTAGPTPPVVLPWIPLDAVGRDMAAAQ
jgi:hypothetical protein